MVEINEREFANMKWRVDNVPLALYVTEVIPELKEVFLEFRTHHTENLSNDILIRFIVLCYDRKSPFLDKKENIIERKVEVLNFLGIKDDNGKFPEDIQKLLKSTDSKTAKMIFHYCKFQDSLTYFALVTTVETYISMNERLGEEVSSAKDSKDTADVMIKLEKIEDRIDKLSNKLFKRDIDLKDFIGSVLVIEGRKRKIVPEDYV